MLKAQLKVLILAAAVAFVAIPALPDVARADPDGLEGSWSGGGPVTGQTAVACRVAKSKLTQP